jgi:hypothetical protein
MTLKLTRRSLLCAAAALAAPKSRIESVETISHQPSLFSGWPTLARRRNGELLVAYSGGREAHVCPFGRVELMRSSDNGKTWSWPQVVMDTPIDDRDAGVLETPKGAILVTTFTSLAYQKTLGEAKDWNAGRLERWRSVERATTAPQRDALLGSWYLRSNDGGLTWPAPRRIPVTNPHGPVALRDGRLIWPGVRHPDKTHAMEVYESKDDGATWRRLAGIPTRPGDDPLQYHELHAVETSGKRIIVQIRNHNQANAGETLQSESDDGGRTWSVPHPIGVWGLPSHLLRLSDGRLLMSYGHRRAPRGNHARLSEDHGRTWSEPVVLSDDGTGDLGYPSTVELPGGQLLTLWYEVRLAASAAPQPPAVLRLARWTLGG